MCDNATFNKAQYPMKYTFGHVVQRILENEVLHEFWEFVIFNVNYVMCNFYKFVLLNYNTKHQVKWKWRFSFFLFYWTFHGLREHFLVFPPQVQHTKNFPSVVNTVTCTSSPGISPFYSLMDGALCWNFSKVQLTKTIQLPLTPARFFMQLINELCNGNLWFSNLLKDCILFLFSAQDNQDFWRHLHKWTDLLLCTSSFCDFSLGIEKAMPKRSGLNDSALGVPPRQKCRYSASQ